MTKSELVRKVAERTGTSQRMVKKTLASFVDVLAGELSEGKTVKIYGFGSFTLKKWPGRRNWDNAIGECSWKSDSVYPVYHPSFTFSGKVRDRYKAGTEV